MRSERFTVPGALILERQYDRWNGELFICWKPNRSQGFRDRKALLKFIGWPKKTPTGDAIREWLDGFVDHASPPDDPQTQALTPEHQATGFGPECHLDENDPNFQTRTVI